MKAVLTDRQLRNLRPSAPGTRTVIHDISVPGLAARVTPTGAISFIVQRRVGTSGAPVRITLGSFPIMGLAQARQAAREALSDLVEGKRPTDRRAAVQAAAEREAAGKLDVLLDTFVARQLQGLRTADAVARMMRRELAPWQGRAVASITKADVLTLLEAVADRSPATARQILVYVRRLLAFAEHRGLIGGNPADRIRLADAGARTPKARERVLADGEVAAIWRCAATLGYPFAPFLKTLLLLGARRGEVADMRRDELELSAGTWSISGARVKNAAPRVLPLPKAALDILAELPEFAGPYIFSTTSGERPVSGFSKMKSRLDREIEKSFPGVVKQAWDLHDFRRTVRTNTSAMPIPEVVRELMLGHAQHGIRPVYDKYRYLDEQRAGFELWAARLEGIVGRPTAGGATPCR